MCSRCNAGVANIRIAIYVAIAALSSMRKVPARIVEPSTYNKILSVRQVHSNRFQMHFLFIQMRFLFTQETILLTQETIRFSQERNSDLLALFFSMPMQIFF